jgi:hypothetical protein
VHVTDSPSKPIRLKHAVCPRCEYNIDAELPDDRTLICPECGYSYVVDFPLPTPRPAPHRPSVLIQIALVLLFACVLALTSNRLLVGLVALGIGLALAVGFRLLRNWCLRDN